MDKSIVIYNNNTGITASLKPLLLGENIRMLVAESRRQLRQIIAAQQIHLLITDVVWPDQGQDIMEGLEILQEIRRMSSLPIIVVSSR
ncbi:MAG: response regulator, partial [Acetatifactor sp.]|nr:response regulator [Acetatifactor sp.]